MLPSHPQTQELLLQNKHSTLTSFPIQRELTSAARDGGAFRTVKARRPDEAAPPVKNPIHWAILVQDESSCMKEDKNSMFRRSFIQMTLAAGSAMRLTLPPTAKAEDVKDLAALAAHVLPALPVAPHEPIHANRPLNIFFGSGSTSHPSRRNGQPNFKQNADLKRVQTSGNWTFASGLFVCKDERVVIGVGDVLIQDVNAPWLFVVLSNADAVRALKPDGTPVPHEVVLELSRRMNQLHDERNGWEDLRAQWLMREYPRKNERVQALIGGILPCELQQRAHNLNLDAKAVKTLNDTHHKSRTLTIEPERTMAHEDAQAMVPSAIRRDRKHKKIHEALQHRVDCEIEFRRTYEEWTKSAMSEW
jgi:hypothetical protein